MQIAKNPRIVIAGSVNSTLQTFKKLIEYNCNLVGVLGLHPDNSKRVSGYIDLKKYSEEQKIPFKYFKRINDNEINLFMKELQVDLFFVIGLSQMIREPLLNIAKYGNIGFHPTKLPEGRGRGAVAWIILGKVKGAATFFLLDEGMDSGPIIGQSEFEVNELDYASDVIEKIKLNIDIVLDEFLPNLNLGKLNLIPQEDKNATFLGQRKPKDGLIDWNKSAQEIYSLIRATSKPLPGAYTIINDDKLIIWKASIELNHVYFGIPGRILNIVDNKILVACRDGAIWIEKYNWTKEIKLRVGFDI